MGSLAATGSKWEPYRLLDPRVERWRRSRRSLADLLAAGRSEATVRSYGMDLLRWFRFLWAVEVAWDRATRSEARDFCRWLAITNGVKGSGSKPGRSTVFGVGAGAQRNGAALLLRLSPRRRHRPDGESVSAGPVPARWPRARASQPDGAVSQPSGLGCIGLGWSNGSRASIPDAAVQRNLRAAALASGPGVGGVLRLHRGTGLGAADRDARRCGSRAAVDHGGAQGHSCRARSCRHRRTRSCGCGCIRWRWRG